MDSSTARNEPIAIIGSGCRFPGGASSPSKLWDLLRDPSDVSSHISQSGRFNLDRFYHPDGDHNGTTNSQRGYLLAENVRQFDAKFFSMPPGEAEAVDPQQRLLLEVVYEAVESAGFPIHRLSGSDTACYVGIMCQDFFTMQSQDNQAVPKYAVTGIAASNASSRVSYFFDWHGPSMTIDTACSSSVVCVHEAVQALRNGTSQVAVACGTNLLLSPFMYLSLSKVGMVSPTGRSHMWDERADGYARGEGVGAVVLKTLKAAIRDGDPIACVIREVGLNHDGKTQGLTMPSAQAQAALIRETYRRAGLDPSTKAGRCQFFEAHGTGTPTGDPKEAEALDAAFFPDYDKAEGELLVGSIKTVIGHTEGCAGIAGLLKASLALQNRVIPPNLLFQRLNPKLEPFVRRLRIPTACEAWPEVPPGQPRRASVNSFGFGGANAHCILESYEPDWPHGGVNGTAIKTVANGAFSTNGVQSNGKMHYAEDSGNESSVLGNNTPNTNGSETADDPVSVTIPFVFSASSSKSLADRVAGICDFLNAHPQTDLPSLAHTLATRLSTLPLRLSISASSAQQLQDRAQTLLQSNPPPFTTTSPTPPSILGIFTGQGAQWPSMGARLLAISQTARTTLAHLDFSLATLPRPPSWTLKSLLSPSDSPKPLTSASLSQPLCTAVQILLVDLLHAAGVRLAAVVGHSSGEIAAAYAAGYLSASDAIRVAYFRGCVAYLACGADGQKGGMLAAGTDLADAEELCGVDDFAGGRLVVAAENAPGSVTLAGDEGVVGLAEDVLADEGRFVRRLRVDTAYHSGHMRKCAGPYGELMAAVGVKALMPGQGAPRWFSSVKGEEMVGHGEKLGVGGQYWVDNMVNQVRFFPAIVAACKAMPSPFNLAVEIGPHPALKGPATDGIKVATGVEVPYVGTLRRGADDVDAFADVLGTLWARFGPTRGIDLGVFQQACQPDVAIKPVFGLPTYPWSHEAEYWAESRRTRLFTTQPGAWHDLLGLPEPDGLSDELRWRNTINIHDLKWLAGHTIQGEVVFPATGYICMVAEAALQLARDLHVAWIDILSFEILKAIAVHRDYGAEAVFSLTKIRRGQDVLTADFSIFSAARGMAQMGLNGRGSVVVRIGDNYASRFPAREVPLPSLMSVDVDKFYQVMRDEVGLESEGVFRGLTSIRRRTGYSTVVARNAPFSDTETQLLFHPAMLDCALQGLNAAFAAPGDGSLYDVVAPTFFERISLIPELLRQTATVDEVAIDSTVTDSHLKGDVDVYGPDDIKLIEMEGVKISPLVPPTAAQDRLLFQESILCLDNLDAVVARGGQKLTEQETATAYDAERLAFYYFKQLHLTTPSEVRATLANHRQRLLEQADRFYHMVSRREHPFAPPAWLNDTEASMSSLIASHGPEDIDVHVTAIVGQTLLSRPDVLSGEVSTLQFLLPNNMLERIYTDSVGWSILNAIGTGLVAQLCQKHPRMRILEVGAGTGGSTATILDSIADAYTSYTYTDISNGFFASAAARFRAHEAKMAFRTLDITRDPAAQGFVLHGYDLVVAQNVLHATAPLRESLRNVRRLLRLGGYLVIMEITRSVAMHFQLVEGSLPGWWVGEEDGRKDGPLLTMEEWKNMLVEEGFRVDAVSDQLAQEDVWVALSARVVDDRIMAPLVDPLGRSAVVTTATNGGKHLVVVGGKMDGDAVASLVQTVSGILTPYFDRITHLDSLAALDPNPDAQLDDGLHVLILTELDAALWPNLTDAIWTNLKRILGKAASVLWVLQDCRDKNPYAGATLGFFRTVYYELPDTTIQTLDVGSNFGRTDVDLPGIVARHMLRLKHESELARRNELADVLWTVEPEIYLQSDGRLYVSRLRPSDLANARYNSRKRPITRPTVLSESSAPLALVWDGETESHVLRELHDLPPDKSLEHDDNTVIVHVSCSFLSSIKTPAGFFFVCVGTYAGTGAKTFCFSDRQASVITVPASWAISIPSGVADSAFMSFAVADLLAQRVVQLLPPRGSVVIFDANPVASALLFRRVTDAGRAVVLISPRQQEEEGGDVGSNMPQAVYLHPHSPRRAIDAAIPSDVTLYVDASEPFSNPVDATNSLGARISASLSPVCEKVQLYSQTGREASPLPPVAPKAIAALMQGVADFAGLSSQLGVIPIAGGAPLDVLPLPQLLALSHMPGSSGPKPASLVAWQTETPVPVSLQPVYMRKDLFRPDRTYWLVGLSGTLGRSLADFMVARGARHIAISSRTPKVDREWVDWHKKSGISIDYYVSDVTSYGSVRQTYASICHDMPPVAGVALGAMVLIDATFMTQQLVDFQSVLRPKVQGALNLDRLFSSSSSSIDDDAPPPLEFFVGLSSLVGMTGNPGQAAYGAGNCFLKALMRDRRKNRGLPGASIDIGRMVGVGYIERALAPSAQERLKFWSSTMAMSESDLHQLFAEAVVTGRSDECDPELVAGVSVLRGREQVEKAFWARNARLGMMIKDEIAEGSGGNTSAAAAAVPVKKLLEAAKTLEHVAAIVLGALNARLQAAKFLPDADTVHDRTPLVDLGVDSLMAVEIRSWFQKELTVDVPVMKILGGASMTDLVDGVIENAGQSLLPEATKPEEARPDAHVSARRGSEIKTAPWEGERTRERETATLNGDVMAPPLVTEVLA